MGKSEVPKSYMVAFPSGDRVSPGYATKAEAEQVMQYLLQQARFVDD